MNMKYVIAILLIASYISLIFISNAIANSVTLATEDPLSIHDSGSGSGKDHNIPWSIYSQVWGWYYRGQNHFFSSDHHGEAFGGVVNYWWGQERLMIHEFILYGRALENGNLVAYDFWKSYPYDTHEELYKGLTFGSADTAQTKVYVHYHHQSRSWVSGWSFVHGLDRTLEWWYSTVNI